MRMQFGGCIFLHSFLGGVYFLHLVASLAWAGPSLPVIKLFFFPACKMHSHFRLGHLSPGTVRLPPAPVVKGLFRTLKRAFEKDIY